MSLVRLLTAGKSLVGAQDTMSRYRLRKHAALPKFISSKNPFAPVAKQSAAPRVESEAGASVGTAPGRLPEKVEPKRAAVATARVETRPPLATAPRKPARPAHLLLQKLNPLPLLAALKPAPKPVRAVATGLPVQGELSLDRVKVVRNDLSDADLEVVPMKSKTNDVDAAPALEANTGSSLAGPSWEQWTSRLFGAGQT